jgi:hypothetical protein
VSQVFQANHISIVPRSGSTADGTITPVELLFGGVSGINISNGATIESDVLYYPMEILQEHLLIMDMATGSYISRAGPYGTTFYGYVKSATVSWDQQTVSGFSDVTSYEYGIKSWVWAR